MECNYKTSANEIGCNNDNMNHETGRHYKICQEGTKQMSLEIVLYGDHSRAAGEQERMQARVRDPMHHKWNRSVEGLHHQWQTECGHHSGPFKNEHKGCTKLCISIHPAEGFSKQLKLDCVVSWSVTDDAESVCQRSSVHVCMSWSRENKCAAQWGWSESRNDW